MTDSERLIFTQNGTESLLKAGLLGLFGEGERASHYLVMEHNLS